MMSILIYFPGTDLQLIKLFLCSLFMLEGRFIVTYYLNGTSTSMLERKMDLSVCQESVREKTKRRVMLYFMRERDITCHW